MITLESVAQKSDDAAKGFSMWTPSLRPAERVTASVVIRLSPLPRAGVEKLAAKIDKHQREEGSNQEEPKLLVHHNCFVYGRPMRCTRFVNLGSLRKLSNFGSTSNHINQVECSW